MSHMKYFYGEGDSLGVVNHLPINSFKTLIDQKINLAATINLAQDEFLAMPKAQRQAAKRVQYLVPGTFPAATSRRKKELPKSANLLFLDIDEGPEKDYPATPYYNDPLSLAEQLDPFNFAAYTTVSSTAEKPRMRIVVDCSNIPYTQYTKAVHFIAERIGLAHVTKESLLIHQPMYLPTLFKGQTGEHNHPLIVCRTDGEALEHRHFKKWKPSTHASTAKINNSWQEDVSGNAMDFLRPAVEGIDLDTVEDALNHIDADCSYAQWLELAAALRHQFTRNEAEKAYELFDTWSSKGKKYEGKKDTLAKWNSLRPNPKDKVPVTVRSLLRIAVESGWSSHKTKDMCFRNTLRWLEDATEQAQLMSEGLGRIISTPLIGHAEEEALLNAVVYNAKRKFNLKITIATLRKDMKRMRKDLETKKGNGVDQKIPSWARGICYIARTNEFYRHSSQERYAPESIDNVYSRKLIPEDADEDLNKPLMRPRDYLLNQVQVPTVYDYVYDPRSPNDTFVNLNNRAYVNLYVPTYPEPIPDGVDYVQRMLDMHLENLVCEEEYRRMLMDFMAHIVQFPGKKIRWAVLLQGAEGCGKTFLSELVGAALGAGHMRPIDLTAVKSGYNDWAYGAQLISVEEIRVAGNNRHEIMNMLKPLITNDTINVNQRFRDSRPVDNVANYLLFTNHHDALVLSKADRRYFVVKSALQTKDQVKVLGEDYFTELFRMILTHPAQIRYLFENWVISDTFSPDGHAPETHYLRQLINDSASETVAAVRESINDSVSPLITEEFLSSSALLTHLEMRSIRGINKQHLSSVLREEGYQYVNRLTLDGTRHSWWVKLGCPIDEGDIIELAQHSLQKATENEPALL